MARREPQHESAAREERKRGAAPDEAEPSPPLDPRAPVEARTVALCGIEVVPARAPAEAAKLVFDPQCFAEMVGGGCRIAGTQMQRTELMQRPRFCLSVTDRPGATEGEPERTDEFKPAEEERQEGGEVACQPKRLLVSAGPIQAAEEVEKRVDLLGDHLRVERLARGDLIE
jgi:hypothetical protein